MMDVPSIVDGLLADIVEGEFCKKSSHSLCVFFTRERGT
jgi:hypothetical protein